MATLAEAYTDQLQPFLLEGAAVRGRMVRLGSVVDTILTRHAYPECVSHLLGEALCVAAILSSNLKQEGIITIQMKGDGPVKLLVVDATVEDVTEVGTPATIALRGYADIREGQAETLETLGKTAPPKKLIGDDSYLAITYDPGRGMQRYQGVVALEGEGLAAALSEYFTQSQQLDVSFTLAVSHIAAGWAAGGIMIERVADEGGVAASESSLETWRTALAYVSTVRDHELSDIETPLTDLLFSLFHEVGVRALPPIAINAHCRCSRGRMFDILMSMPASDRADMVEEGAVSVHCQFCNTTEKFTPEELKLSFNQ